MNSLGKVGIVCALAAAVGVALLLKRSETPTDPAQAAAGAGAPAAAAQPAVPLPRLLELGSVTCIPCKAMAPIIEELRKEYAGTLRVEFVDVKEDPDAANLHGIRVIPTQIFFDASGAELFRHEGFYAKSDILAKWIELGVHPGRAAAERK